MNSYEAIADMIRNGDEAVVSALIRINNKAWRTLQFEDEESYLELMEELQGLAS